MFHLPGVKKTFAYVLICSLIVTSLITLTTRQSEASRHLLPPSLAPTFDDPSDETAPPGETVDEATRAHVSETLGKLPLSFEENRGQVDGEVKYFSRGRGYTLFLTPTEAVLTLRRSGDKRAATTAADPRRSIIASQPRPTRASVLRMKLSGANPSPAITGESEMGVRTNYFKGSDPQQWRTGVASYERVKYEQAYPGIDMIYYGRQQQLEYDFEVAPGADTSRIALEFAGVKRVKVERQTGDLILKTSGGEVRQHRPVAYQEEGRERREVASQYVMRGRRRVGIELGEYDPSKRLVIDPVLSYSTYLGGSDWDYGSAIAVDSSGIAYVTGSTSSHDFPTRKQYDQDRLYYDAFVTKLDTNVAGAASLLYSTYLGGNSDDYGRGIAIDASGHAYVTGYTYSTDFPTLNQYQTDQAGSDTFVTKLDTNASGAASLLYSTYLGGNSQDSGNAIAIDASGHVYVTGETSSNDFPLLNPYQTAQVYSDLFVTKLNPNLAGAASLLYSTFLGGDNIEYSGGIAVDASGNVYVTGETDSSDFPTLNEYQKDQVRGDAFAAKLNTTAAGAASLLYSTYLGGNSDDWDFGSDIAVDASGNVYVIGSTESSDFPVKNQYQSFQGGYDAFVTKLDMKAAGAASLLYSTFLGGSGDDGGGGIAVDSSGHAYVSGSTGSRDFPTLNQYHQDRPYYDAFVTKLDTNTAGAASLLYSTYLGGGDFDYGGGIAIDASGNAYVTGTTYSYNFPTLYPYQKRQAFTDAFVTKLSETTIIGGRVTSDGTTGISGVTITLSGAQSRTAVTNSTGYYSFRNFMLGGNYTITPSRGALTFIPSQRSFTNLRENRRGVNFTTQPVTISGKVTKGTATGVGLAGVTMILTGGGGFARRTVTTSSDGTYSFSDVPVPNNYRVTPWKTNYAFQPSQVFWFDLTTNQSNRNFIATLKSQTGFTGTGP